MDDTMDKKEMISALADGQLRGPAFTDAVQAVCSGGEAMTSWHAYHVIGDVLRSADAGAGRPASEFVARFNARLAQEQPVSPAPAVLAAQQRAPAANDETFRWKLVAGVASFAAVGAIGWSMVAGGSAAPQAQLASATARQAPASAATVLTRSESGAVMIRDAKLDELLAAHRQLAGASALQMPAGFVRSATFENHGR